MNSATPLQAYRVRFQKSMSISLNVEMKFKKNQLFCDLGYTC